MFFNDDENQIFKSAIQLAQSAGATAQIATIKRLRKKWAAKGEL